MGTGSGKYEASSVQSASVTDKELGVGHPSVNHVDCRSASINFQGRGPDLRQDGAGGAIGSPGRVVNNWNLGEAMAVRLIGCVRQELRLHACQPWPKPNPGPIDSLLY
jgi:hypothetical protein